MSDPFLRWSRDDVDAIVRDAERLDRTLSVREERDAACTEHVLFPEGAPSPLTVGAVVRACARVLGLDAESLDRARVVGARAAVRASLAPYLDLTLGTLSSPRDVELAVHAGVEPSSTLELLRVQRAAIRRSAAALRTFAGDLGPAPWPDAIDRVVTTAAEDVVRIARHAIRTRIVGHRDTRSGIPFEIVRAERVWSAHRAKLRDRRPATGAERAS